MSLLKLCPLPTIGDLLRLYKVKALKKLSQNFLLDLRLTDKIVRAAGPILNGEVCEIGPGPGGITRSIMNYNPHRLIVIEKDERFAPILENLEESSYNKFQIIYADILQFKMSKLFDPCMAKDWNDESPNIHLIGNLPFNIATALIILWLRDISLRESAWRYGRVRMTLTFQEEVARRIVAPPGTEFRCRLSVMCQNWCDPYLKFVIPGRAFLPKPQVDVAVVHMEPLRQPLIDIEFQIAEKLIRTIFNNRQKLLRNNTLRLFPKAKALDLSEELLHLAKIHPTVRPFEITNDEWNQLCCAYKEICDRDKRLYNYDYRGNRDIREDTWKQFSEAEDYI